MEYRSNEQKAFMAWAEPMGFRDGNFEGSACLSLVDSSARRLFDHGFLITRVSTLGIPGVGDDREEHGFIEMALVARTYEPVEKLRNPPPEWAGLKIVELPVSLGPGTAVIIYPVAPGPGTDAYLQTFRHVPANLLNVALPELFAQTHAVCVVLQGGRDLFVLVDRPMPDDRPDFLQVALDRINQFAATANGRAHSDW